ncbi:MAG: lysophospholipid acyltransferase family protein [Dermatophilaceae bacterium]
MEPLYWSVIGFCKTLFAAQGLRFTMTGEENFPDTGGAVVTINHTGYFDFTYAGMAALPTRRLIRFMAKESVFRHPVTGPLMRGMHHIPVDRGHGATAFQQAVEALRRGEVVAVYPEATISRSFELKEFKTGAARMAQQARVPVVPVVVWGAQRVWTKDHPKRLGRTNTPIFVDVGAPMSVAVDEDVTEATERIRSAMARTLERLWTAYPPMEGPDRVFLPARLGGEAPTPQQAAQLERAELAARAAKGAQEAG